MSGDGCVPRKPWELSFPAEPREVAGLRRVVRLHLRTWGLSRESEAVQLCVSELVTQVIRVAGVHAPTTVRMAMHGTYVRIEVISPRIHAEALAGETEERSLRVVDGTAARRGLFFTHSGEEVRWCEIATDLTRPYGHGGGPRVARAEAMLALRNAGTPLCVKGPSRLTAAKAENALIEAMTDLMSWGDAHGYDGDDMLDAAQKRFDAEL